MKKAHKGRDRSDESHAVLDGDSRIRKAAKIRSLVGSHVELGKSHVLDIGTGSGHIPEELGKYAKKVTSVDVTDERRVKKGYVFKLVEGENLPFKDNSFDVVVSNHVAEHTPNQKVHFSEIFRVVKPGGVIYLATPNKLWITDPHYRLPFISWMPRSMSSRYLKLTRGGEWDIYPVSHRKVKRSFADAEVFNLLPKLIRNTDDPSLRVSGATKVLKYLPNSMDDLSKYYSPTLIYAVKKPKPKKRKATSKK